MSATLEVLQEQLSALENKSTLTVDEQEQLETLRNQLCKLREAHCTKGKLLTDINQTSKTLLNGWLMSIDVSKLSPDDKKRAEDLCEFIAALHTAGKDTSSLQKELAKILGAENVG